MAQQKYKYAQKPDDANEVIEQYSKVNMDILAKINELQRRLEPSVPGSSSSLNSKIFNEHRGSIVPGSIPKSFLNRRASIYREPPPTVDLSLEGRMEAIEQKLDQIISYQSKKQKNMILE